MAEKDATARLRRAVKENNVFLVRRLIQRTDMRNPDPATRRYTSLAWAAVLGHEATFDFLLTVGHDDAELSRDSENNTVLMLLCDVKAQCEYCSPGSEIGDIMDATLRMARTYYDRYPWILDWSNIHGKTPLHIAAIKGHEELVRMLCDLGADFDLSDNKGNTPLHYASAWGHIPIVQHLIERGCQFAARNNEGFTASDYAYSFSTRDNLQDTARTHFENSKRARRAVYAQAAARGNELGFATGLSPPTPSKGLQIRRDHRLRSGSGTSRTTATSDSGDLDNMSLSPSPRMNGQTISVSSSPSQPSTHSATGSVPNGHTPTSTMNGGFAQYSPPPPIPSSLHPSSTSSAALAPIVNRMRERDADAMEKYMMRNRSGSAGTSTSIESRSQNEFGMSFTSTGPSSFVDEISALQALGLGGSTMPRRRLRPSMSAAQLRPSAGTAMATGKSSPTPEPRSRSGTNPSMQRPLQLSPLPNMARSSSTSASPRLVAFRDENLFEEPKPYVAPPPPSQPAQTPAPDSGVTTRRLAFNILTKSLSGFEQSVSSLGHRRGSSTNSSRAA